MDLKYKHYSSEEFAEDEKFWLWVLEDDINQAAFWERFIKENPEKAKEVERAKGIVLQLNADKYRLEDKKLNTLWEEIQKSKESFRAAESSKASSE